MTEKSTGGSGKKLTPYNRFIRQELQRLKAANPSSTHAERFKLAASNWKNSPDNKKSA
ncbi:hypothetical protein BKA62DRAFT_685117 [Auriculariales sp. MPI-PUGE-AT-0066]|nr:hypothetical protein BKA62DRAFT_685117 [Auriculariales sp. MPI-PUGE-AT-0066]